MKEQADPLHDYIQGLMENRYSVWDNFYKAGGYGMYPTTLFGFMLVAAACIYCFRLDRRWLPVVVIAAALTVASGALGTFTGMMVVFSYAQRVEPMLAAKVAVVGSSQALANIVFALVLGMLGGIAALAGAIREQLRKAA